MPSQVYKRRRLGSYKSTTGKTKVYKGKSYGSYGKMSMYKQPKVSYATVYPIERTCTINYLVNRQLGFQNLGQTVNSPFLGFNFSLRQVAPYIAGLYDSTSASGLPNSSELAAVFDQYRIKSLEVKVFYSHNSSATGEALIPVLRQCLDFDSVDGTNTLQEYQNCRIHQLQNLPNSGLKFLLLNPTVNVVVQDTQTTTGTSQSKVSPWLDTNATEVPHFGMRFELSSFQEANTGTIGRIQFVFKIMTEFRRPR